MKKMLLLGLAILLTCGIAFADGSEDFTVQQVSQTTNCNGQVISATQTNTEVALFTAPRTTKTLTVYNTGANEAWVDLDDSVATVGTDDEVRVDADFGINLDGHKTSNIGIICDTGETATVLVVACR